ncbi:hypothetical protein GQ457_15G014790 [Hibiscus cannabinus]
MARFEECLSISCPPLFEGEAYSQWRNVKKYFILAQDFEIWDIIEEGYIEAPKKKKKKRSENDTKAKLNSRAMHILLYGLNEEVSKKVSTCKKAKEMWEKLERLYGKEEKKDGVPSCANLLQSSKLEGVLALDEPKKDEDAEAKNGEGYEGESKQNGECLREEQRRIRAKFGRLKEETEMVIKQSAGTQIKLALMFNILKAREGGDFIEASKLTKFLRENVAKERADASLNDIKNENSG